VTRQPKAMTAQRYPGRSSFDMPRFNQGTAANSGNSWAIGSALNSAWAGSTENPVGNVRQRSHGAMIEVMLQVGGELVKSTISLPTPPWHSTLSACVAGSR